MSDNRQIKKMYSKEQGKMVEIPIEIRATVDAYKVFKRPAFSGLKYKQREIEREKRKSE